MNTIQLDEHLEEENVKIEEEPNTKPSKYNYSIPKNMKKYIFHLVR